MDPRAWVSSEVWCRARRSKLKDALCCRYGTPFLISLGLSEQLTSLVWLAGPLSGLIAQPLIGSDKDFGDSFPFADLEFQTQGLSLIPATPSIVVDTGL